MGEVGMHVQNTGGRSIRSPNHQSNGTRTFSTGLRNIRSRARNLSNAVGYDSREAPRTPRNEDQS